ncbi:hypothetical protein [uncultured Veillonella sp.]|uniref:DUF1659 domain-containing protein n=1 Tax=uncultured Veillonella sp. TaxID=159268 RepID=UPI002593A495|nr:hypothetical protein [uncultured Veillonella sp.]
MSEDMLRMMDENEEAKASEAKAVEDGGVEANEAEAGEAKVAEVSEAEANEITRVMAGGAPTEPAAADSGATEDGVHGEGDEGVHADADSDGAALDDLDDGNEDEEERGPIWDAMVQTTKLQLRLNEDIAGATKVKLVTFNGIVPNKTDDELNLLSDKLASLFAYPSVGFVRIDTKTYKPGNPLL